MQCVLLYASYTSFLISYLTLNYDPAPFNSLEGMHKLRNKYRFYLLQGSSHEEKFAVSILLGYVYTTQLTVSSSAIQPRLISFHQSEIRMVVSDWLQLIGLSWIAADLTLS